MTTHGIYSDSLAGLARKEQQKQLRKRFARKLAALSIGGSILQFALAQIVCFGLSFYHIKSGIWGPWFLMEAASSLIAMSVAAGMPEAAGGS